jgi:hypothetical protein
LVQDVKNAAKADAAAAGTTPSDTTATKPDTTVVAQAK